MERIKIKNFRKIKETWELNLAPITFFTGTNNSGKSSVLKAIMALDDFGASDNHLELSFNGRNRRKHKIDSYTNAVNWYSQDNDNLDMEFEFEHAGYEVFVSFTPLVWENHKLLRGGVKHLFFQRLKDGAKLTLERKSPTEYQFYAESAFFERRRKGGEGDSFLNQQQELKRRFKEEIDELQEKQEELKETDPIYISVNQDIAVLNKKLSQVNKQIKAYQKERDELIFTPSVELNDLSGDDFSIDRLIRNTFSRYFRKNEKTLGLSDSRKDFHRAVMLGDALQEALNFRVEHLSPHRNNQIRLYLNDETSTDIYEIINTHSQDPIPKGSEAGKFIKRWMGRFDIGTDYKISPVQGVASIVQVKENGKLINLVDKGFGAGQIFAIILRIALTIHQKRPLNSFHYRRKRYTPIILIEEPEANLHPKLQSELVEMFLDAHEVYRIRFILETHSEYIIRKTQLKGLEREFFTKENKDKNPFKVYYFGSDGPYEMCYTEEGRFERDFGKGFYDVAAKLNMETLKKSRQNQ